MKELHLQVDLMPEEAIGSKIATAFEKFETMENLKICLLRAEVANPDLPKALEELGAIVDDIAVYKTVPETERFERRGGEACWKPARTGSRSRALRRWNIFMRDSDLPKLLRNFRGCGWHRSAPETSKAIRAQALGLKPAID